MGTESHGAFKQAGLPNLVRQLGFFILNSTDIQGHEKQKKFLSDCIFILWNLCN